MGIWWIFEGLLYTKKDVRRLEFKTLNVVKLIEAEFFPEVRPKRG
jgi:hypothetical protein